jgi:pseudaminic acid synthase
VVETVDLDNEPIMVIAEISANHLGSYDRAKELVTLAKDSGATHVKFQHYRPDTITVDGKQAEFTIVGGTGWDGRKLWDLYREAMMPWEWTAGLSEIAHEVGIAWFSSPFDESAVDFLETYDPPLYKVASFEIVDLPLIRRIAETKKPIIISTGMATELEIEYAVNAARESGASEVTLLRTNSGYPATPAEMDLLAIPYMESRWDCPIGLSDHTLGSTSAVVAVALGARVFEKHLTVSRALGGPDSHFSSEPEEFRIYVKDIFNAKASLGSVRFGPTAGEKASLMLRPSLRAVTMIAKGEKLTHENVRSVRPAGGLEPDRILDVLGKVASEDIQPGQPIRETVYI